MKNLRWMLPGLALAALLGNGCIILSTQVFAHFSLSNPFTINPPGTALRVEHVDLNSITEYADNKNKLKGLSDIAILGTFKNLTGGAGAVELWITPGTTNLATYAAVTGAGGATKLWAGSLPASPSSRTVDWAVSNTLFSAPGKAVLINQIMNGGVFTVYVVSSGNAANSIEVDNGEIVLVISAGK
jgi:hypothetical protein